MRSQVGPGTQSFGGFLWFKKASTIVSCFTGSVYRSDLLCCTAFLDYRVFLHGGENWSGNEEAKKKFIFLLIKKNDSELTAFLVSSLNRSLRNLAVRTWSKSPGSFHGEVTKPFTKRWGYFSGRSKTGILFTEVKMGLLEVVTLLEWVTFCVGFGIFRTEIGNFLPFVLLPCKRKSFFTSFWGIDPSGKGSSRGLASNSVVLKSILTWY